MSGVNSAIALLPFVPFHSRKMYLRHNRLSVRDEIPCRLHHPGSAVLVDVIVKPPQVAAANDHLFRFHAEELQRNAFGRKTAVTIQMHILKRADFSLRADE